MKSRLFQRIFLPFPAHASSHFQNSFHRRDKCPAERALFVIDNQNINSLAQLLAKG